MQGRVWISCLTLAAAFLSTSQFSFGARKPPSGSVDDDQTIAFINSTIERQWADNKVTPSALAGDYEFLRRVYLDIVGRIPTVEEIRAFRRLPAKTRRADQIERLLDYADYGKNWANLWAVWLLTRTSPPGVSREATRRWLEDAFASGKPYDKMVEEILTATGKSNENGAVNFVLSHVGERIPDDRRTPELEPLEYGMYEMVPVTARTTRLFLGIQTQCTQCHDHPFIDGRKQQQYWGINAFFRQVGRDEVPRNRRRQDAMQYMSLRDDVNRNARAEIFFERRSGTLLLARPAYLDGTRLDTSPGVSRRKELAKLVIKDPHFAKAFVNRMWGHFFGRGFTHPVDDFGEHNPVSHPELLDRLARDFVTSNYDQRRLIRWICNSRPYQLTSMANASNQKADAEPFFSRMLLKAMTPEQLVDSIFVATNTEKGRPSKDEQQKMHQEWLRDFTVNFGDDEGNEATFNGTVIQALMLMNGERLNEAVKLKPGSTLRKTLSHSPSRRLEYIYLAALTRPPTSSEIRLASQVLNVPSKDPAGPWQDILWALLNSNEFILNH